MVIDGEKKYLNAICVRSSRSTMQRIETTYRKRRETWGITTQVANNLGSVLHYHIVSFWGGNKSNLHHKVKTN